MFETKVCQRRTRETQIKTKRKLQSKETRLNWGKQEVNESKCSK